MSSKFIKYRLYNFISKCFNKMISISLQNCRKFNDFKNDSIEKKLTKYLRKAYKETLSEDKEYSNKFNNIIWIFWWQGTLNMPVIVRSCYKSILHNSGDFKVVLITKENINNYTDIPDYIYKKVLKGCITLTHFSDVLRYNLLKNHGGLWIDATNYCTSKLKLQSFNKIDPYTTIGESADGGTEYVNGRNKCHQWVSGKWTGFLIGGHKGNSLFYFMDNFFKIYWKYNTVQIDYNLVDYALYYAYKHNIGGFKTSIDAYSYNNLDKYELINNLNVNFNKSLYDKIISNTQLFKLSYKLDNSVKYNKGDTFYNRIVHNTLNK